MLFCCLYAKRELFYKKYFIEHNAYKKHFLFLIYVKRKIYLFLFGYKEKQIKNLCLDLNEKCNLSFRRKNHFNFNLFFGIFQKSGLNKFFLN